MSTKLPTQCSHCSSTELYTCGIAANGPYGPSLLPGLGGWFKAAKFDAVLCASCGHYQLFANTEAREQATDVHNWKRIGPA